MTPTTLSIASLTLSHFRNYESLRLELAPTPVLLTGHNGAGKTNILEALSFLTPGRGLRGANLGEIVSRTLPSPWAVAATVRGLQGETKIGTGIDPESERERRVVHIEEKNVRQSELAKHMAMLWLTPQMEQLFNESASASRRFLDRMVYNFDPAHATQVSDYEKSMRERNRLLEEGNPDTAWLGSLEQAMAAQAVNIVNARLSAVETLNRTMQLSGLSFPKAHVTVAGLVEDKSKEGTTGADLEEFLQKMWEENRRQDAAAGRTLSGVHRSEMQVTHVEKGAPAQSCSSGEQKALLLSMMLAQARAMRAEKGVVPVLLLDEIITHLDATRRLELFAEICQIEAQIWMTGTDASLFAGLPRNTQHFQIDNGHLIAIQP